MPKNEAGYEAIEQEAIRLDAKKKWRIDIERAHKKMLLSDDAPEQFIWLIGPHTGSLILPIDDKVLIDSYIKHTETRWYLFDGKSLSKEKKMLDHFSIEMAVPVGAKNIYRKLCVLMEMQHQPLLVEGLSLEDVIILADGIGYDMIQEDEPGNYALAFTNPGEVSLKISYKEADNEEPIQAADWIATILGRLNIRSAKADRDFQWLMENEEKRVDE